MTAEERLAYAERHKFDVEVFYLSQSRFLRQVGDGEPTYVPASPSHPVRVVLPAKVERPVLEPNPESKSGRGRRQVHNADGTLKMQKVPQSEDAFLKRVKVEGPKDVRPNVKTSKPPPASEMIQKLDK